MAYSVPTSYQPTYFMLGGGVFSRANSSAAVVGRSHRWASLSVGYRPQGRRKDQPFPPRRPKRKRLGAQTFSRFRSHRLYGRCVDGNGLVRLGLKLGRSHELAGSPSGCEGKIKQRADDPVPIADR